MVASTDLNAAMMAQVAGVGWRAVPSDVFLRGYQNEFVIGGDTVCDHNVVHEAATPNAGIKPFMRQIDQPVLDGNLQRYAWMALGEGRKGRLQDQLHDNVRN